MNFLNISKLSLNTLNFSEEILKPFFNSVQKRTMVIAALIFTSIALGCIVFFHCKNRKVVHIKEKNEKIDFKDAQVPVVNPLTGKMLKKGSALRELACNMLVMPLRIDLVVKTIAAQAQSSSGQGSQEGKIIVAVPGQVVSGQLREWLPQTIVKSMQTKSEFEQLVS